MANIKVNNLRKRRVFNAIKEEKTCRAEERRVLKRVLKSKTKNTLIFVERVVRQAKKERNNLSRLKKAI